MNWIRNYQLRPIPGWVQVLVGTVAVIVIILFAGWLEPDPALAWDCRRYNFRVTSGGDVQVENRSGSDEPAQTADVFVNGSKVIDNVHVPPMKAGTDWTTFVNVSVPSGDWTWRVVGSKDCEDSGKHEGDDPTKTPKPPTETPEKPTHTPDPTATDTPPPPTLTATPDPTFTDTPDPTATKPPPTDPPRETDTPPPPTKPPPTKTKTPIPPTQTATPRGGTPTPSNTPTPTPTDGCAYCVIGTPVCYVCPGAYQGTLVPFCEINASGCPDEPEEVWAYLHLDQEAIVALAQAIEAGNERSNKYIEQHGELIRDQSDDLIRAVDGVAAEVDRLRNMLVWIFIAILVSAGSLGLVYYGVNRKPPNG